MCIRPYVKENSVVLEIGPGRGAWTKTFLKAREIWCLDALSAEHNKFWEYVGRADKIKYIKVDDFSCSELPDNHFNYLFSYGTLCHVSFEGISEYMRNIYPKLKKGSECFIMIADYEKHNAAINNLNSLSALRILEFLTPKKWHDRLFLDYAKKHLEKMFFAKISNLSPINLTEDNVPRPGRWYNAGIKRTCDLLQNIGYHINDPDVCASHRDPIIHFSKP